MENRSYIQVIIPLKLEWEPFYAASEEVNVGDRVRVVFSNKEYVAVVSAVDVQPDVIPDKVKPILGVERDLERILAEEIQLWRQVAEYYLCSIGEVYKAAYPAMKVSLEEARASALARARASRERMLSSMKAKAAKVAERLERKKELLAKSRPGTKAHAGHLDGISRISRELETILKAIEEFGKNEAGTSSCGTEELNAVDVVLSDAQNKAYEDIRSGFEAGKPVLLHGVTGSGKTQIYIRLALEELAQGRGVLYLVPEIALSRQLQDRLYEHFGERLLVFHSKESAASRRNTAELIRNSSSGYIVLGTRSSLFLPHHDLGLIIIDEEHDSSYKQDSPAPRYNGRDTALMLATIQRRKCNVIMGSATPSFEETYNCQYGKHSYVCLTERYHGGQSSEIQIIDTKAERRKKGMEGSFSRKLIESIRKTLGEGRQVMLLRSRRAWATAVQCEGCGEIVKCPHCNVSLTLHKGSTGEFMACHYCGHRSSYTPVCGKCGGTLSPLGAGTQKIEEEASLLFPDARIARLDSDTTENKTVASKIIRDFERGEIDILVGTQMLAKGFDFSNLSLVAVLAADTLLGMQDFRADEKALQLLEQFRGRCGRRSEQGLFIIQTSQPEHPVYSRLSSSMQNNGITDEMMQERRDFNFPPFSRIIEITIKDNFEDRAQRMASRLAGQISRHFGASSGRRTALESGPVTGPYTPVIDKIAQQHIRTIRVSLRKDRNLKGHKAALRGIVNEFEKSEKYIGHISLDVDPA